MVIILGGGSLPRPGSEAPGLFPALKALVEPTAPGEPAAALDDPQNACAGSTRKGKGTLSAAGKATRPGRRVWGLAGRAWGNASRLDCFACQFRTGAGTGAEASALEPRLR